MQQPYTNNQFGDLIDDMTKDQAAIFLTWLWANGYKPTRKTLIDWKKTKMPQAADI